MTDITDIYAQEARNGTASSLQKARLFAGNISRTLTYLLGAVVLVLGGAVAVTKTSVAEIANWAQSILGFGFMGIFALLVAGSIFCLVSMNKNKANASRDLWLESGLHLAGGITTLALTFTLLGISLGIGGLSEQVLTPETVQEVIRGLTAQFSLAFMTTVIGLPTAALLRGSLMVSHSYHMSKQIEHAINQSQTARQHDDVSQNAEIKEQVVETIADAEIIEEYPSKGEVK